MRMKPCPFCAAPAEKTTELWDKFDAGHIAHVHCMRCGADGPSVYSERSADDAIMRAVVEWNRRRAA